MLKKLLLGVLTFIAMTGTAFAEVDINKADQAALNGIRGIGPSTSKAMLEERKKGGNFKDWADLEERVKGVGDKSAIRLSQAGLTVDGKARPNTPAAPASAAKGIGKGAVGMKTEPKEAKTEAAK
ncbi:MAG: uptake protein [Herminiimonas sp.]|nr:uptake protein [Herminiimonas sp.]